MDFCHFPVKIVKRSKGRSAVEAAAYRSGTKLTNEWDGQTHDYTRKRGVVHTEIMLPPHAPPEFSDRATLWNSVEQIEKAKDSQLARDIEAALPRELSREQQLALIRSFVKDNFVDKGMSIWRPPANSIRAMPPQSGAGLPRTKRKPQPRAGTGITAYRREKPYD